MVQLLIVDDEVHAVKGVQSDLDVEKLGISKVFAAFNIRQAKQIFTKRSIDIMLCDIEMPQGSGLELLEWVKEHYPETECIFLTNHAEFQYAKQAIQLGSLDYLLKPVPADELEDVIYKAVDQINTKNDIRQSSRYQQLWNKHQPLVSERFWLDLLNQKIASNPDAVKEAAALRNLPFAEDMSFIPVLLSVQRWYKEWSIRDEKILEFALKNSAREIIIGRDEQGQIVELDQGLLLIILTFEHAETDFEELRQNCKSYIASCNRYFYCDLSCYIGKITYAHGMAGTVEDLKSLEQNNVASDNKVFLLGRETGSESSIKIPDMSVWSAMLRKGSKDQVIDEVKEFFEHSARTAELNVSLLRQFHQDFLQMIYFVLNRKGIQAHELFCNASTEELSGKATRSVTDMLTWVKHIIAKAMDQADAAEQTNTVVEKVKQYIATHLDQGDLSREDIAKHVFLNPDYLSRIFKKETGFSISEYLLQERVQLAKELLCKTEMTVSTVASAVGYSNFSHFSKIFKKHTDLNPRDYRQQRDPQ